MSDEELENRYNSILEEQFVLKYHGKLSIFEQENITAEDREWFFNRLKKEKEAEEDRSRNQHTV